MDRAKWIELLFGRRSASQTFSIIRPARDRLIEPCSAILLGKVHSPSVGLVGLNWRKQVSASPTLRSFTALGAIRLDVLEPARAVDESPPLIGTQLCRDAEKARLVSRSRATNAGSVSIEPSPWFARQESGYLVVVFNIMFNSPTHPNRWQLSLV